MKDYKELRKPIIFIGTGRSGSTIISEILMRHKELAYPSNYHNLFYRFPIVGIVRNIFDNKLFRVFGSKQQLNKVGFLNKYIFKPSESYNMWNYLTGEHIDFSRDFLLDCSMSEERRDFIRSYFYKMVKYQSKSRLALKIAGPSRMSCLLQIFPDAYFILIRRSIIATISSLLKVDFWAEKGKSKLWFIGAYSKEELEWAEENINKPLSITTFQLKKIINSTDNELIRWKPNYLEVTYEEFVQDPNLIISKILRFANLEKGSSDIFEVLGKLKIYNQNRNENEYFSQEELDEIYSVLKSPIGMS